MAETTTEMTAYDVAEIVRGYLKGRLVSGNITLDVREDSIWHHDGWWKVGITPSAWPTRFSPLYEELAIIEDEMQDGAHLDVLLSVGEPVNTG